MKIRTIFEIGAVIIVIGFAVWAFGRPATTPPTPSDTTGNEQTGSFVYINNEYGYTLRHPLSLETKEYTQENVVFGTIDGETVNAVAEARVMDVRGAAGETFAQAVERELTNLCAADGPQSSFSCTSTKTRATFTSTAGVSGTELYLTGQLKNLRTGTTTTYTKGPFVVYLLNTGSTASRIVVIHAPLNKTTDESDVETIISIARSFAFVSPEGARYMDIESYVKNNISTLSPKKEVLGGTFFVTRIETHGGTGTVSYEDGHNAYTADFTYTVDEDGKPTVTRFIIRP